ncbi:MAG TPA: N-6 DNA methylase [Rhizomicrobium sp.]|jgi:methylase of polypeptide subunit release factors
MENTFATEPMDIEALVDSHAQTLADDLTEIVDGQASEEDVRIAVASRISAFAKDAQLTLRARHEYGLAGGRIDSKYGGLIIEYKRPSGGDRLDAHGSGRGTKAVVEQIRGRFEDFAKGETVPIEKVLGVGLDGRYILFARYRGNKFDAEQPMAVSPISMRRLFRAVLSLGARGHSFTAENLVRDFGNKSLKAQHGVSVLYNTLLKTASPKAKVFFHQWTVLFGEVCGYDVTSENEKIAKLAESYGIKNPKAAQLLFALQTYYAIVMKFLAAEIAATFTPLGTSIVRQCAASSSSSKLSSLVQRLEQGGIWTELGISNFLEGDLFSWYLAAWDDGTASVVRTIAEALIEYDPATLSVDHFDNRDLLKHLYQQLFPRTVRHDLGEYYTPDWLAERLTDQIGFDGNPSKRVLDPGCGSGTFLVEAINRCKEWYAENRLECGFDEAEFAKRVLNNIVGFDLNPLAVMAARVNYLLAVRDLLKYVDQIELPVYLCDSIRTPSEYGSLFENQRRLKTSVAEFIIPAEVTGDWGKLRKYAEILEECVRDDYSPNEFLERCKREKIALSDKPEHVALFSILVKLQRGGQDGIWARIIKNAFAPLLLDKFDFILGNPPWVNWESLPDDYRQDLKSVWNRYDLLTLDGAAGRHGGGKKDLAMLFVYVCIERYLRSGGQLGFVITQSVFKTKGAGDGFRRLSYKTGESRTYIHPLLVEDLSRIQVFEGATNATALFVAQKSAKRFEYPVEYKLWSGPSRISQSLELSEVIDTTTRMDMDAAPIEDGDLQSPWLSLPKSSSRAVRNIIGKGVYKAYEGANTGGLNGVYWVHTLEKKAANSLVENLHDIGKIKVEHVTRSIENEYIKPLLRGRDISPWSAEPSLEILFVQDAENKIGITESKLKKDAPKLFSYLKLFEGDKGAKKKGTLRGRKLFQRYFSPDDPFYTMYNIGPHTLAKHKVVWRDMGLTVQAAVVTGEVCPEHHVMFVPTRSDDEAHYICAVLMSTPCKLAIAAYTTNTGKSTHVTEHIKLPRYSNSNNLHGRIAQISKECHKRVERGNDLLDLQDTLDRAVASLWGLSEGDTKRIQKAWKQFSALRAEVISDEEEG